MQATWPLAKPISLFPLRSGLQITACTCRQNPGLRKADRESRTESPESRNRRAGPHSAFDSAVVPQRDSEQIRNFLKKPKQVSTPCMSNSMRKITIAFFIFISWVLYNLGAPVCFYVSLESEWHAFVIDGGLLKSRLCKCKHRLSSVVDKRTPGSGRTLPFWPTLTSVPVAFPALTPSLLHNRLFFF